MDGHEPDGAELRALERGLALAWPNQALLIEEVDEAAEVATLLGFEGTRDTHELAQIRHAALPVRHREDGAVVAGFADRAVEQVLEGRARRVEPVPLEPLDEGADAHAVAR